MYTYRPKSANECAHNSSRKEQANSVSASPKSQFQAISREIGYYLLILREKYGIMGVYPEMIIGIMATFPLIVLFLIGIGRGLA